MRTKTYDFRSFISNGQLIRIDDVAQHNAAKLSALFAGVFASPGVAFAGTTQPDIRDAFDPVIHMLQDMALPVASIVLAWACLQAMIGHPAQAVDKAKWAVLGYLAMKYVPGLLKSLG
ncbi:hypothetical protein [Alicyclobacillus fastidiosus]|uniref:Uncharacterized protein n=1 Tax=Alicyclobacillus fastidiosus TaxID=392011 RepID=A0ABV5AKB7_9BACL|nr:hypothetical protein [Alicyclobacillus fastidiosus]WEH09250.1 hypothetical protein PYS47_21675 [Alicyclobacillus fastidiosus]